MSLIVVFYCLIGIAFITIIWSLFKSDVSYLFKKITRIIIPVVILLLIGGLFVITYHFKKANNEKLDIVLKAININSLANKTFTNNKEKEKLLDSLYCYYNKVDSIAHEDSVYSFLIGADERISNTLHKTLIVLKEQIKRYERLNDLLPDEYIYDIEEIDSMNIYLIRPNTIELENLNIAFKLTDNKIQPVRIYIQILKENKVLFSQFYEPRTDINSFIIPNNMNDKAIVKLGYIIQRNDTLVYKYLTYEKYGSVGH